MNEEPVTIPKPTRKESMVSENEAKKRRGRPKKEKGANNVDNEETPDEAESRKQDENSPKKAKEPTHEKKKSKQDKEKAKNTSETQNSKPAHNKGRTIS